MQKIIVNTDAKMKPGKLASQVAHASMAVILDYLLYRKKFNESDAIAIDAWITGQFTKIVLKATEQEILRIKELADILGIPNSLIEDNGKTVFNGVKTVTALALGPTALESGLNLLTEELKLL